MAGLLAQQLFHLPLHGGHPGAAAHQQHFAQLAGGDAGVPQGVLHRLDGAGEQVSRHHLELRPGDREIQMMGPVLAHRDERQVELGRRGAGKLFFGLFGLFFQPAHGGRVPGQVDAVGFLELGHGVFHNALVKVVAAQVGVAAGGQHRERAVFNLNDGDVERAAAQVVDEDFLGRLVVQAVSHSRRRGLVDDAQDVQARDAAGVLGGLALAVVKVGGHRDDGFRHRLAQIALGVPADLGQDHGADLLRSQVLAVDVHPVIGAHVALDAGDGAPGVGGDLALGRAAHQPLAILGKGYHAGSGPLALRVGNDNGLAALDHCHTGVGGTQVNSDHFAHFRRPLCFCSACIFPCLSYRFRMTIS